MKKFGKFEKRPEAAQKKEPNVKSALLQTYMVSLLSLVLCVTMFFGTSYAWFTSEVTNEGNEIYIGTLDVGLFKQNGDDLSDNNNKLFDGSIRWEPGFTALETIKVVNEGDLAFKYVLSFVDGKAVKTKTNADVTATISDIAKYFDVWVYAHHRNGNAAPAQGNYEAITKTDSGWVKAGPLSELLEGKIVLEGSMYTVRTNDVPATNPPTAETGIPAGTTDGVRTVDTYTIALHMNEDATSEVMGHKISLNVKLVAYQMASEKDSMGQTGYDHLVTTEADLKKAFEAGGNVTLLGNVTLTEGVTIPAGKTVNLDLNGFSIRLTKTCTESYSMISNKGNLTITGDGEISFTDKGVGDPSFGWGSYTIHNSGNLVVENATIKYEGEQNVAGESPKHCSLAIFQYSGSTTINGGTISNPNYRSVRLWHGDMTINGGTFEGQVWVQAQAGEAATLKINNGSFCPKWNDASSVYVENSTYDVNFGVTGGNFTTKIGVASPDKLAGCITGGTFTADAKNNTNAALFAADGNWTVTTP